jgi:hypothetical protein
MAGMKKARPCDLAFFCILARLAGIEPTTPWFVAKYSIQLSYSRFLCRLIEVARLAGIEPTTPWFVAKYSIQLSYSRISQSHYMQSLARLAGIEPTTPWFVAKYSIQLSYSRVAIALFYCCS